MRERYGWYDAFGIGYDAETAAWLRERHGPLRARGHPAQGG